VVDLAYLSPNSQLILPYLAKYGVWISDIGVKPLALRRRLKFDVVLNLRYLDPYLLEMGRAHTREVLVLQSISL
jgi:hypothetical protein